MHQLKQRLMDYVAKLPFGVTFSANREMIEVRFLVKKYDDFIRIHAINNMNGDLQKALQIFHDLLKMHPDRDFIVSGGYALYTYIALLNAIHPYDNPVTLPQFEPGDIDVYLTSSTRNPNEREIGDYRMTSIDHIETTTIGDLKLQKIYLTQDTYFSPLMIFRDYDIDYCKVAFSFEEKGGDLLMVLHLSADFAEGMAAICHYGTRYNTFTRMIKYIERGFEIKHVVSRCNLWISDIDRVHKDAYRVFSAHRIDNEPGSEHMTMIRAISDWATLVKKTMKLLKEGPPDEAGLRELLHCKACLATMPTRLSTQLAVFFALLSETCPNPAMNDSPYGKLISWDAFNEWHTEPREPRQTLVPHDE